MSERGPQISEHGLQMSEHGLQMSEHEPHSRGDPSRFAPNPPDRLRLLANFAGISSPLLDAGYGSLAHRKPWKFSFGFDRSTL